MLQKNKAEHSFFSFANVLYLEAIFYDKNDKKEI
jgi:hypothetical protein